MGRAALKPRSLTLSIKVKNSGFARCCTLNNWCPQRVTSRLPARTYSFVTLLLGYAKQIKPIEGTIFKIGTGHIGLVRDSFLLMVVNYLPTSWVSNSQKSMQIIWLADVWYTLGDLCHCVAGWCTACEHNVPSSGGYIIVPWSHNDTSGWLCWVWKDPWLCSVAKFQWPIYDFEACCVALR